MKGTLGHWTKGASAHTAMSFANHMLGTWHQHAGAFFHNLTVSKDPHLTAELYLQVHDKGPHQYKFKVKAFAEEHVRVNAGYAVLNMLQKARQITQKQKGDIIYEMTAAQLGRSIKGVGDSVKTGAINEIQSRNVTNQAASGILNASLEFYLPTKAEQEIYRNILKDFKDPQELVEYEPSIQSDMQTLARNSENTFNWRLSDKQASLRREGFFFPHLTTLWSAPYIAMIRQR
jgi:spore coat protein CotF